MRLGSQMDDTIHMLFLHELQHPLEVTDIHADKAIIRPVLDIPQIRQIAGISQLIEVNDPIIRIFVHKQPHHMRADEPGAAGNNNASLSSHMTILYFSKIFFTAS